MEVVFGFAVGYWIGVRHGRDGLQEAADSARAIWASPETKRLLGEGLAAIEPVLKQRSLTGVIREITELRAKAA
jgi:hypothetical protein